MATARTRIPITLQMANHTIHKPNESLWNGDG